MNYLVVFNLVGFNLAWFGLVYWGNTFIPISLLLLVAHFRFIAKLPGELLLVVTVTVIGILVDSVLLKLDVFIFTNNSHIPLWLMMLWACFSATLCHSLRFLTGSKLLQLVAGGVFAPLSYIAGQKLAAVQFSQSLTSTYLLLSLLWAVLFVLFFALKAHLVKGDVGHV